MSESFDLRGLLLRGAAVAVTLGVSLPSAVTAQSAAFAACYVPQVGAMYLIKRTGLPSACLAQTHVEIGWTEGAADSLGAVLQAAGTVNAPSNPVDWTKLKGVPAGFADGVDDGGTVYTALPPIALNGTTFSLSLAGCTPGDGWVLGAAWSCERVGTVTSITTGPGLMGGAITTAGTVSVNFAGSGVATTVARSDHTHAAAGTENTAVGQGALHVNTAGYNTAVGFGALFSNTSGQYNTAVGTDALAASNDYSSTAVGWAALRAVAVGGNNSALGQGALSGLTSGGENIAIGAGAGSGLTAGSGNIYIGFGLAAPSTEVLTLRIGNPCCGAGSVRRAFIGGIRGVTTGVADALPVVIDGSGQLGTVSSSRRFKQDIQDIGDASRDLLRLRPVSFRYKQPSADGTRPIQYGLIAEEVAQVYPELVAYDSTGQPTAVMYHVLPAMLLNEVQRQEQELAALRQELDDLKAKLRNARTPCTNH